MTEPGTGVDVMVGVAEAISVGGGVWVNVAVGGRVAVGVDCAVSTGLESHILGWAEEIDDARPHIVQTPGQFCMDGGDEIQGHGEEHQHRQAKQDLYR